MLNSNKHTETIYGIQYTQMKLLSSDFLKASAELYPKDRKDFRIFEKAIH